MNRVKDFVRRRKSDSSAKEKIQQGGDPMDVGAVDGITRTRTATRMVFMQVNSKARAKEAKEEKAKESVKIADQPTFLARVPSKIQGQRQRNPRRMPQLLRSWTSSPRVPQEQRR